MSTCTPAPDHLPTAPGPVLDIRPDRAAAAAGSAAPSRARRSPLAGGPDRASQAQTLRTALDTAAAAINAHHAQVLSAVIAMREQNLHRSAFGFSALRDLLLSQFDFTFNTAGCIAAIARLSGKFRLLTQAAVSGAARIDQVAYAVRQLDQTPAMRLFARTPFRTPVPSPFDAAVQCATPEAMVAQYCQHASFNDLRRHLEELWAAISEETELLEGLGEQSLQRLELVETGNGMWHLEADLTATTGRLLDKYLKTACPPPRQDEADADGVLPAAANRRAEALHQLLAGYGTSPEAATRHGHTATLDLTVDLQTLRGEDTGRLPLLEGRPISVAQARLLACEAGVVPSVFDYGTGEAVELGRALRLPNTALRRKLELEQPHGCAWHGCERPVAWCEAHHLVHWADGGPTEAANLILVCRFHHGRLHTPGWTVEKTGPGQALITHHDHEAIAAEGLDGLGVESGKDGRGDSGTAGCGCSDWRTDADMDTEHAGSDWEVFPTGLYRTEWSEALKPDLDGHAQMIEQHRALAAIRAAKAKARARFTINEPQTTTPADEMSALSEPVPAGPVDHGRPPFLPRPSGRPLGGKRGHTTPGTPRSPNPPRGRALQHAQGRSTLQNHPGFPRNSEGHRHHPDTARPCRCPPRPQPPTTPRTQTGPETKPSPRRRPP
jgi:hypothetical protein